MAIESGGRRRLAGVALAAVVVVVLIVGVAVFGLTRGPSDDTFGSSPPTGAGPSWSTQARPEPKPLPDTADPEVFARQVAQALFTWDPTSGAEPVDYAEVLVDAGDPTGMETAGLASDVRSYLPAQDAWVELARYRTRQWLVIDTLTVPDAWADAEGQAAPGQLLPGTTAYTVAGTRHRAGTWDGDPVETSEEVAFTIFLTCRPSFEHCRLLRLSELNNPLR
ncbi:hypothetical protein [Jiangella alkaliphila]|uniref:Uncharacterized protein n=1 Tax=Jiangella alkaliphila TaxID=419479 RepID=A0A1H2L9A7_9ACTN|nr:hypothetical protein [Jiangella alkaliphila]SDU77178.1 hypothetical protein SAMN04488563_5446 [Jiangella alkaliphila]